MRDRPVVEGVSWRTGAGQRWRPDAGSARSTRRRKRAARSSSTPCCDIALRDPTEMNTTGGAAEVWKNVSAAAAQAVKGALRAARRRLRWELRVGRSGMTSASRPAVTVFVRQYGPSTEGTAGEPCPVVPSVLRSAPERGRPIFAGGESGAGPGGRRPGARPHPARPRGVGPGLGSAGLPPLPYDRLSTRIGLAGSSLRFPTTQSIAAITCDTSTAPLAVPSLTDVSLAPGAMPLVPLAVSLPTMMPPAVNLLDA
jgi:hypothetical protein